MPDTSTDVEWEKWGASDPYFGVLTDPKFRSDALDEAAREAFFRSGAEHVEHVLAVCRRHVDPGFAPQRVLDFGCGVGRLLVPFAAIAREVVGVDVSPSMLAEARRNCDAFGRANVVLAASDDALSRVDGTFDLVHSCIVLQHIEIERGRALFARLVERVRPGGLGALHVTYGLDRHVDSFGQPPPVVAPPPPPPPGPWRRFKSAVRSVIGPPRRPAPPPPPPPASRDPEMQMNYYNVSELLYVLQRAGVERLHAEFTDHGGALGAMLLFRVAGAPTDRGPRAG